MMKDPRQQLAVIDRQLQDRPYDLDLLEEYQILAVEVEKLERMGM